MLVKIKLTRVFLLICFIWLAYHNVILTYYKKVEAKTTSTNLVDLHFQILKNFEFQYSALDILYSIHLITSFDLYFMVFCDRFVFECFLFEFIWLFNFSRHLITLENKCPDFCIKFRFCDTFSVKVPSLK